MTRDSVGREAGSTVFTGWPGLRGRKVPGVGEPIPKSVHFRGVLKKAPSLPTSPPRPVVPTVRWSMSASDARIGRLDLTGGEVRCHFHVARVKQSIPQPRVADIAGTVRRLILESRLRDRVPAGGTIAVGVGSRGITAIPTVARRRSTP